MGNFLAAGVFGIFALLCGIFGAALTSSDKKFQKNAIRGQGIIVGYCVEEHSSWKTPQVQFFYEGREQICRCQSSRISPEQLPVGTRVEILYLKKQVLGIEAFEVRLTENDFAPPAQKTVSRVLYGFCAIFLIVAIVFGIMGIMG